MTISNDMCRLWWLLRQVKGPLIKALCGIQERIKCHQAKSWTLIVDPKLLRSADSSDWPGWSDSDSSDDEKCNDYLTKPMKSWTLKALCAKLLMVRTMLQSTKTFDTKLVRYIEWSNVQPCVHHISPIWPHYGHFGPKNSHIWPYLAIGSPSCPKLVEHWLNMVEHRSPHLGWATWTPLHPPKWPWGAWEGPQNGHF